MSATQLEILQAPPLERSAQTPWPLWPLKMRTSHAHEEGAERHFSVSTKAFIGTHGKVNALQMERNGDLPAGYTRDFVIEADLVLLAMGFSGPARQSLIGPLALKLDDRGNIATDVSYQTSEQGVFAAGDARRGASLIVWAIAEGRKMATAVDLYLQN
jgi:glutamate synthase (NADPH/NADH) small chain